VGSDQKSIVRRGSETRTDDSRAVGGTPVIARFEGWPRRAEFSPHRCLSQGLSQLFHVATIFRTAAILAAARAERPKRLWRSSTSWLIPPAAARMAAVRLVVDNAAVW